MKVQPAIATFHHLFMHGTRVDEWLMSRVVSVSPGATRAPDRVHDLHRVQAMTAGVLQVRDGIGIVR